MGMVYRALDTRHGRLVAIKVLKPDASEDERSRRLFRREARAMARLDHPGIISIQGYGKTHDDLPYLVMEWVEGRPLAKLAAPARLETVVTLIDRLLEALAHAHARGVIHRDLKPANILLSGQSDDVDAIVKRGVVKVLDFGIARVFDDLLGAARRAAEAEADAARPDAPPIDRRFSVLARRGFSAETQPYEVRAEGTPRYMAPELYRGKEGVICPANDVYAVGVILYELLSGKKLFDGLNPAALMTMQIRGEIPPCQVRPELRVRRPPEELLRRMLAADPFDRIQNCADVRRELVAWYRDQKGAGHDRPAADRSHKGQRPHSSFNLIWDDEDPLEQTQTSPSQATASSEPELNLLAWRPMPLVGRVAEQAWLWQHLEETDAQGAGRVLFIQGDPGVGKTHLARWLAESAVEAGLVVPLWCDTRTPSLLDGLRGVVERQLYAQALDGSFLRTRVRSLLERQGLGVPGVADDPSDPQWRALLDNEIDALGRFLRPHAPMLHSRPASDPVVFFEEELARDPRNAELLMRYGQELANTDRGAEAVVSYVRAAELLVERGMLPEAAAACQAIFRLEPSHTATQLLLARIYAQQTVASRGPEVLDDEEDVILLSPRQTVRGDITAEEPRWRGGGFDFNDDSTVSGAMEAFRGSDVGDETPALLDRLLRRAARDSPVLFILDGVEVGQQGGVLQIVDHLMRSQRPQPFPLLIVITGVQPFSPDLDPASRSALELIIQTGRFDQLVLAPLADSDLQGALSRFESLDARAREEICKRAEGNPLFALELAQHEVQHDGDRDGAVRTTMPRTIGDVWRRRIGMVAARSPIGIVALRILELAAVLGEPVRMDLLLTAWETPELADMNHIANEVSEAWELWIEEGILIEEQLGRARFKHGLLRETLLTDIESLKRRTHYHAAAARAYTELGITRRPASLLKVAHHLIESGDPVAAFPSALRAAQQFLDRSAQQSALEAFRLCERILEQAGVSDLDTRRDPIDVGCAQLARRRGDVDTAVARGNALRRRGQRSGMTGQLGLGEIILAECALHNEQLSDSGKLFGLAHSHFLTCDDQRGQSEAMLGLARLALRDGQLPLARTHLASAMAVLDKLRDAEAAARAYMLSGQLERQAGQLYAAEACFEHASRSFELAGNQVGLARALGELGQVALDQGDLQKADLYFEAYLRQSEAVADAAGTAQARANLGQTRLRLNRLPAAIALLGEARAAFVDLNDRVSGAIIDVMLAHALAADGQWHAALPRLTDALAKLAAQGVVDLDVAEALEGLLRLDGAPAVLGADFRPVCQRCVDQWHALGVYERARGVSDYFNAVTGAG